MLDWLFTLLNLDVFQSIRTQDPFLNEKRIRERKIVVSFVAAFTCLVLAAIFGDAPPQLRGNILLNPSLVPYWAGMLFLTLSALFVLWCFVEWVAYVAFWKRKIE